MRDLPQCLVVGERDAVSIVLAIVFLPFDGPATLEIVENSDLGDHGCPAEGGLSLIELLRRLRNLLEQRHRRAVRANQRAVHLFLAVGRAAPLPTSTTAFA